MAGPDLDERGNVARLPLLAFDRYIELGMVCLLKLTVEDHRATNNVRSIQISLTPSQCREIAENLMICAQVIELERPTTPQ